MAQLLCFYRDLNQKLRDEKRRSGTKEGRRPVALRGVAALVSSAGDASGIRFNPRTEHAFEFGNDAWRHAPPALDTSAATPPQGDETSPFLVYGAEC